MAIPQCSSSLPLGLDLGLGLGLGKFLLRNSRAGSVGLKQRRQLTAKKRPFASQIFQFSERCLPWSGSWGGPLHLHSAGNGDTALPGSIGPGKSSAGFGTENLNETRLLGRLYVQHQHRIAASNSSSSSSFPGSSGVDVTPQKQRKDLNQYREDNGTSSIFENQSSVEECDSFSGGWESEQDHVEAQFAERDHSSQNVSNGNFRELSEQENGMLDGNVADEAHEESWQREGTTSNESPSSGSSSSTTAGTTSVGPKEAVYEVMEVNHFGNAFKRLVSRRQLLRTSGLRLRDLRRVDPSLWVTNSAPALLVRDQAILLNLGSLRAIATTQEVLIFDQQSVGARSFIETLVPRLNDHHNGSVMPFELEVIESALISRTQRVERALMDVEPRVLRLLEVLPTCMTADVLEELRVSKQALVEVGAKAGALRQMLLELLEHPQDIRRMVIMGRICSIGKDGTSVDCLVPQDKQVAEDEEEEMEMLLEYYLQRCESCHGQALKLLSSAKEMEDSIAVNLSSRRLEVSRLELLLQVGTFCAALGALVAGIFGMNLKSYLEERALAFWFTTGGIIFGGIALFICMFTYLSNRKIL